MHLSPTRLFKCRGSGAAQQGGSQPAADVKLQQTAPDAQLHAAKSLIHAMNRDLLELKTRLSLFALSVAQSVDGKAVVSTGNALALKIKVGLRAPVACFPPLLTWAVAVLSDAGAGD